jgi:hypothetical protein
MAEEKKETTQVEEIVPPQGQEEIPNPTTEKELEAQVSTDESLFDGMVKEGDGTYSLKIGESVYKGKDQKEVMKNLVNGVAEKDTYISKLKNIKQTFKIPEKKPDAEQVAVVEPPNANEVYRKNLEKEIRNSGIDSKLFAFNSRDQWRQYQSENDLEPWEVMEVKQKIERVLSSAESATQGDMSVLNQAFLSSREIETAHSAIEELLEDSDLTPEQTEKFVSQYADIIDAASKKSKDFTHSADIVVGAQKAISKIKKESSAVSRDIQREVEKGKDAKKNIKTPAGGTTKRDEAPKKYNSYESAREDIFADIRAGRL